MRGRVARRQRDGAAAEQEGQREGGKPHGLTTAKYARIALAFAGVGGSTAPAVAGAGKVGIETEMPSAAATIGMMTDSAGTIWLMNGIGKSFSTADPAVARVLRTCRITPRTFWSVEVVVS